MGGSSGDELHASLSEPGPLVRGKAPTLPGGALPRGGRLRGHLGLIVRMQSSRNVGIRLNEEGRENFWVWIFWGLGFGVFGFGLRGFVE